MKYHDESFKLPERLSETMVNLQGKKIVTIGGGTGTFTVNRGLRTYLVNLTAICSTFDSGGNTGELRDEYGVLPPGDLRRGLLALADNDTLRDLFNHRFPNGHKSTLSDYSLGNLLLLAAEQIWGPLEGIRKLSKLLDLQGQVLPISIDDANVIATLSDGTEVKGEGNIDTRSIDDSRSIEKIRLEPSAFICREAAQAIIEADLVVIGPGDLYSSIIPNLLVNGFTDALSKSKARVVYIVNLMTKPAETAGYDAFNFIDTVLKYGIGREKFDAVLINQGVLPPELVALYKQTEKAEPVVFNKEVEDKIKALTKTFVCGDFVSKANLEKKLIRHDSAELARALMNL